MPRTKTVRKKAPSTCAFAKAMIPLVEGNWKTVISNMESGNEEYLRQLRVELTRAKVSISKNFGNKTIGELSALPLNWSGNSSEASTLQILNGTQLMFDKKPRRRTSSLGDDEGYLTAESSKSTSGGRRSRAQTRQAKTTRASRSASIRSKNTTIDKCKTPANRLPPALNYGTVTPKMKPNTPQVLLRRPKMGEVALSMEGSPLLTGPIMTDNLANVNIPLEDGRILSIQPKRGLRISQIPQLDLETKRQLETLRDNLTKVCALSSKK